MLKITKYVCIIPHQWAEDARSSSGRSRTSQANTKTLVRFDEMGTSSMKNSCLQTPLILRCTQLVHTTCMQRLEDPQPLMALYFGILKENKSDILSS